MKLTKKERADLTMLSSHVCTVLLIGANGEPIPRERLGPRLRRALDLVDRLAAGETKR